MSRVAAGASNSSVRPRLCSGNDEPSIFGGPGACYLCTMARCRWLERVVGPALIDMLPFGALPDLGASVTSFV